MNRPAAGTSAPPSRATPPAELGLGILYANGHGMEIDLPTAASWYRKAAEKGNAAAQVALGLMYLSGQGSSRISKRRRSGSARRPIRATRAREFYLSHSETERPNCHGV
jgi:TPR repeat protein